HGTTAPSHAGARVVVDFDDEIVEAIGPPQPVAWFIGRPMKRLIVAAILGIFAPSNVRVDAAHRKAGARPGVAVSPPPQPKHSEPPAWCRAVTFAFVGPDTGTAKHDRNCEPPCGKNPVGHTTGPSAHAHQRQSNALHVPFSVGCRGNRPGRNCRLLFYARMLYFAQY